MASMPESFINCRSFRLALGACPLRTVNVLMRLIGASAASPTLVVKTENCLYICRYVWYVRIPYMHSALFVRDAIFPHCTLGSCNTACSRDRTRKAEQWESTQQGFECEERAALLRSEIETDY